MRGLLIKLLLKVATWCAHKANELVMTQRIDWRDYINWVATVEANEAKIKPKRGRPRKNIIK